MASIACLENNITDEVSRFINQVDYPCVAARLALKRKELRIHIYSSLGSGRDAFQLGKDLLNYKEVQKKTNSQYLSFIAVYENSHFDNEETFEKSLWLELSALAAAPGLDHTWDPIFSSNPEDKNFCFSVGGAAFFVVGLHPSSSRKSRQFYKPALVFNLYQQFEMLDEETEFYPMVKTNRKRDSVFQGTVNPMVEKYSEKWESIQFSGRDNPPDWKCPFHKPPITSAIK